MLKLFYINTIFVLRAFRPVIWFMVDLPIGFSWKRPSLLVERGNSI